MSPVAHAASAALVAATFADVEPNESAYLLAALISASALDLDHMVYAIRDRAMYRRLGWVGHLHHARSVLHELVGLLSAGLLFALLFFIDQKLAYVVFVAFAIHVVEDWLFGKSYPLSPADNSEVQFFSLTFRQKVLVDVVVVIVFGALWAMFLSGRL